VRVRIGLHTGEAVVTDEGYVDIDVNRAARIMSAGHGGQVLLSESTWRLLGENGELVDLGALQRRARSARVRHTHSRGPEREPVLLRWVLIPHWAKDDRIAYKMINARAETLLEKNAYRSLIGAAA
jgi:SOS response associated peptidase (SRAP)/Adenylate and Guanylate cyclase catalytic domain